MEKKTKIKLLAIQFSSIIGDVQANVQKMENLLNEQIAKHSPDIVILPEVWTCGWDCQSFHKCAEKIEDSQSLNMLKNIAIKFKTNIIGGSFIRNNIDGSYSNTCPVINKAGKICAFYEKNHLFSYYGCDEGKYIQAGNNPVMVNLDGINIGLSICYDIRFPEIYRAYRKHHADVLVNMAAWGSNKKLQWDTMTASRAIENQTYFVALTQTGKLREGDNLGHSMIIDYKGEILSEINNIESGICATIDLEEMYDFRKKCTILNDIKKSYEVLIK